MSNTNDKQNSAAGDGSLQRCVRRIANKWEEMDLYCEYRNLPRDRMEAMLTTELSALCAEYESAYRRLHSQISGYLHGEEWEHWQKYNEPRYAPNVPSSPTAADK